MGLAIWNLIESNSFTKFYHPSLGQKFLTLKFPINMGVSLNGGTPKSSILIGFSILNHPFWGTPIFGNTHITHLLPGTVKNCEPSP